jgi:hypothetical protein
MTPPNTRRSRVQPEHQQQGAASSRPLPDHDPGDYVDRVIVMLLRENRTYTPHDFRELLKRRAQTRQFSAEYWARYDVQRLALEQARVEESIRRLAKHKRLLNRSRNKGALRRGAKGPTIGRARFSGSRREADP